MWSKPKSSNLSGTGSTKRLQIRAAAGTISPLRSMAPRSPRAPMCTSIFHPDLPILRLFAHVLSSLGLSSPAARCGEEMADLAKSDRSPGDQSPEEIRSRSGGDHRAHRALPHAVWQAHVSYLGGVDPLSAIERQSRRNHLRSLHRTRGR